MHGIDLYFLKLFTHPSNSGVTRRCSGSNRATLEPEEMAAQTGLTKSIQVSSDWAVSHEKLP